MGRNKISSFSECLKQRQISPTQHNQYTALIYLLMEKHKKQNQAFFISVFSLNRVKMMVVMASHEAPPISSTCTVLSSVSSVSSVSELRAMRQFCQSESVRVVGRWWSVMSPLLLLTSLLTTGSWAGSHERRLLNDLMTHYQKLERPVLEESQAVSLKFGLTLQQILDVVSTERLPDSSAQLSSISFSPSSTLSSYIESLSDRMKKIKFSPQTFG